MTQDQEIKVSETVWHGRMPYSPDKPKGQGLTVQAVNAASNNGPTIVLAAAYRLGKPLTEYYGGQLPRPIWVVAVNQKTGDVYEADLNGPGHPPIMVLISDKAAESDPPDGSFESAFFNVDMAALLKLPDKADDYKVFLWIDDIVSQVITATPPENPARGKGKPVKSALEQCVKFTSRRLDLFKEATTPMQLLGKDGEPVVYGLMPQISADDLQKPVIWIMTFSHRDRKFGWVKVKAKELPSDGSSFTVNPLDLIAHTGGMQKVFTILLTAAGMSNVNVGFLP